MAQLNDVYHVMATMAAGLSEEKRETILKALHERAHPKCHWCQGVGYKPSNQPASLRVVDGEKVFVTSAQECNSCKGTGVEPDCKLCNNTGSVSYSVPIRYASADGDTWGGSQLRGGPCSCPRSRNLAFLV